MVGRRFFVTALMILAISTGSFAESRHIVTIDAVHAAQRLGEEEWALTGLGLVELDLLSTGNRRARGQLRVTAAASADGTTDAEIDRAYVKVRLPFLVDQWFHITAGRARLSWGDGAYFNAADILYGTRPASADFTEATLRDEASWLLAGFFPLGQFAFFEPVVLVPGIDLLSEGAVPPTANNAAAGFRIQGKVAQVKSELGYLYDGGRAGGNNPGGLSAAALAGSGGGALSGGAPGYSAAALYADVHRPALSFQGNLGVDWYLSASTAVAGPGSEAPSDLWKEELAVSFGVLHILSYPGNRSLSLRLESLVLPWQEWTDAAGRLGIGEAYALSLFPEVVWATSSTVSVYLRSVVSPIDLSARLAPGMRWNAVEGVTFYSFVNASIGEATDSYALGDPGGLGFVTGLQFVY